LFPLDQVPRCGTFLRTAELDWQRRPLGERPVELSHPFEAGEVEAFSEAPRELGRQLLQQIVAVRRRSAPLCETSTISRSMNP
jgi:hypothetical protein